MATSEGAAEAAGGMVVADPEPPARVVANSAWSILAQGTSTVVGGGVTIYAVRSFSTATWGQFSTAVALVTLFTVISGAGLGPLALRELSASPSRQDELLGEMIKALALTSVLVAPGLVALTIAFGYSHEVLVLVLVMMPLIALTPGKTLLISTFNARSRMDFAAWFQLAESVAYGAAAVIVLTRAHSIAGLAASTVVAASGAAMLGVALLRRRLGIRAQLRQPLARSLILLRTAVPIGGIALVGIVYARVDTVMLSVLSDATSVARYAVPYSLVQVSWLVPSVVSAAFFPLLIRRLSVKRDEAERLFFLLVRAFLFASVPIAMMFALAAPALLPFVFGDRYGSSALVLQIMAWTSVFGFQNYIFWYGLLASRRERAALAVQLVGLAVNVSANALAIPLWGPAGAAAALVASDLMVVAGQVALVHRNLFRVPFARILSKPLAAGAIAGPFAVALDFWNAIGSAFVGASIYVAALLALGYISREEWRPVVSLIRQPSSLIRPG